MTVDICNLCEYHKRINYMSATEAAMQHRLFHTLHSCPRCGYLRTCVAPTHNGEYHNWCNFCLRGDK